MTDLRYWLWLTLTEGMNSRKITALLEYFNSPEEVFFAEPEAFSTIRSLTQHDLNALQNKSLANVQGVTEACKRNGIRILTFDNPLYPQNLANIFDPPYVLYVRSREKIDLNQELLVSIVGNRVMTEYGRAVTLEFSQSLARAGVIIVSGMARGIDGAAHTGALRAGGRTVAVLGCGVDVAYPKEHEELMAQIVANGMVISEYPPGTPPLAHHFPARNRIISGLSAATVVTEAAQDSGSLITAGQAAEQGREVFAVPGNINQPHSAGTNELLKSGARPITSALDVILEFQDEYVNIFEKYANNVEENPAVAEEPKAAANLQLDNERFAGLSDEEKRIVENLSLTPVSVDALCAASGLSAEVLNSQLTMLEIKGFITSLPGRHYCLKI